jgi:hypothetical protein
MSGTLTAHQAAPPQSILANICLDDAGAGLRPGDFEGRLAAEDSEAFPQPPARLLGVA